MKNPDLGRYRSNRTSKVQVWFSGSGGDKTQGQEYRTNPKGVQQHFQCGRLRPVSLNSIFFGCFCLSLLPVRGDTHEDFRQRYLLNRVAAPCVNDRKKCY